MAEMPSPVWIGRAGAQQDIMPKKMLIDATHAALTAVAVQPEVEQKLVSLGLQPRASTSPEEAAAYLRLSPRTLEKQRVIGGGPRFHKFGRRVMYALTDLEAWASERSFETTFDPEYIDRHPGAQRDDQ